MTPWYQKDTRYRDGSGVAIRRDPSNNRTFWFFPSWEPVVFLLFLDLFTRSTDQHFWRWDIDCRTDRDALLINGHAKPFIEQSSAFGYSSWSSSLFELHHQFFVTAPLAHESILFPLFCILSLLYLERELTMTLINTFIHFHVSFWISSYHGSLPLLMQSSSMSPTYARFAEQVQMLAVSRCTTLLKEMAVDSTSCLKDILNLDTFFHSDPCHSEYAGISKLAHSLLVDTILSKKGQDRYYFQCPTGWGRLQTLINHLNSYQLQEHARASVILPLLLRCFLKESWIAAGF